MRLSTSFLAAALAGLSAAVPVERGLSTSDVDILQFALTLEHLENVFYKQALTKFKQEDFVQAGFRLDFLPNLKFLVEDEQSHVESLESAIKGAGGSPVAACEYNFPYTDVQSFVTLSAILEGVGTSAYLGAAGLVKDKTILNTAGSILVTESLHTSQQRGSLGQVPAANPLGTPVSANGIFTVASAFIKQCPSSNAKLPFKAFPALNAVQACQGSGSSSGSSSRMAKRESGGRPQFNAQPPSPAELADLVSLDATGVNADESSKGKNQENVDIIIVCAPASEGQTMQFNAKTSMPKGAMVTFVSGLTAASVNPKSMSGSNIEVIVPKGVSGQTFVFITKGQVKGQISDSDVVAGPAVVEIGPQNPNIDQKVL